MISSGRVSCEARPSKHLVRRWGRLKDAIKTVDSIALAPGLTQVDTAGRSLKKSSTGKTTVPHIAGLPHISRAAFSDRRNNFVRSEFVAWRKRHLSESAKFNPS